MTAAKLTLVKQAAQEFVSQLCVPPSSVGMVVFSAGAVLQQALTQDPALIRNAIRSIPAFGAGTSDLGAGITMAQQELVAHRDGNCSDIMLVFADGEDNVSGTAILAANNAKSAGTRIISIGIAPVVSQGRLMNIASPGDFYLARRTSDTLRHLSSLGCTVCPNPTPEPEPTDSPLEAPDLGDAPDSTNHYGLPMTAGSGSGGSIGANYPTVYDPVTGLPVGPKHVLPRQDIYLGTDVSTEVDADLLPDEDAFENIYPPTDAADQDFFDDGLRSAISMTHCITTTFAYTVTAVTGPNTRLVNGWIDFNRDGDWNDTHMCTESDVTYQVPEWMVQNQSHSLAPGIHVLQSPAFRVYDLDPGAPMWMRLSVAEQVAPNGSGNPDGRGPNSGYGVGETEDYYLTLVENGTYGSGIEPDEQQQEGQGGYGILWELRRFLGNIGILPPPPSPVHFKDSVDAIPPGQHSYAPRPSVKQHESSVDAGHSR
ncbi:MAG: VWA domain-containing protein [Ardenticatenales bacterium]|nr:VWA domain-containing protein [Ardenticatenales bacterium]